MLLLALALAATVFQDDLPPGKGRETLENTCTECHGVDRALTRLRTTAQWREIAVRMRGKGATMSDEELTTLVEYLAQNFGAVDVNKADARELEKELGLSARVAAAVVRYREAKGPFREWRDLLKVQGVERARVEAVKDRLIF
jgi:competence ComEA-like helix-hairpin-helix protein